MFCRCSKREKNPLEMDTEKNQWKWSWGKRFWNQKTFSRKRKRLVSWALILTLPLLWPLSCNTESVSDFNFICSYHLDRNAENLCHLFAHHGLQRAASMNNANKQSQTTQPLLKWYSINLDTFPRPFFLFWLQNLGHPKQQLFLIFICVTSAVVPHQHHVSTDWKAKFHSKEFN